MALSSWPVHRRRAAFGVVMPLVGSACLAWACAMSPQSEPAPNIDPTLPGVDASWNPSPEKPSEKSPSSSSSSSGSTSSSSSTSGGPQPKVGSDAGDDGGGAPQVVASKPAQGEVVISEVMFDPSTTEPPSEWIEVHNTSSSPKLLSGLTIVDGGNRTHVIGGNVVVAPSAYVILARSTAAAVAAKVPAGAIAYEYGAGLADNVGVQLANGTTGGVFLKDGTNVIAQADYGGWFTPSGGSSVELKTLTFAAAAQSTSWCLAANAWTTGADKGTPGAANDCP